MKTKRGKTSEVKARNGNTKGREREREEKGQESKRRGANRKLIRDR